MYHNFFEFGPGINYISSASRFAPLGNQNPMYADLMKIRAKMDCSGFPASEENFKIVKDLHHKNLIIPLVGDFAGPKTITAVGKYLKERGATLSVFYVSNVESYLNSFNVKFCANVATLPLDQLQEFPFVPTAAAISLRA